MATTAPKARLTLAINWPATVLALALLPLLLWLGCWQLDRAEQKRVLKALYSQRAASAPVPISQLENPADSRYQPLIVTGQYLPQWNLLLDNKIYRGSFGYELLTAFELDGGAADKSQWLWVNRGWLKGDAARLSLPAIPPPPAGPQQLIGQLHIPQSTMMQLAADNNKKWPRVTQVLDIKHLQQEMQQAMFPYSLRLAQGAAGVLERNWLVVNIEPAKHTGYAVQWFSLAAMAVIILLLANTNLWALYKQRKARQQ
ncbi:SURF1 family protein [Dasania sp. GY-MA-18]|uniref:SURF1-like protein n=1 Tax=Dasania phycosphaerae TaxID=2950436 RepID=A0A9J6RNH1_9GAMM|nr:MULTISPECIES: SURF1 family protein [Dasania]MCR8923844.1 SURF1 family protein [Dasania sp. GY-MA-18]MCZ0866278.1 SURF1 family protein [Dasania phycosphaerae]MCZ0870002.1 SURF1 family protein [Dasania phycosphaerae]